ncbi:transposase [Halomonas korlensis]|uniref:Transposase n=1 Tax=Halomonas korlensis TaxID=463301 RepID=A0A1I7HIP7_9GAMM|nr:Transposase [Halomonas korlensis]
MRYPAERKEAILKKMAPPMSMTIPELAEQEGITATTLYHWRKQARSAETWRDACMNAKADAVQQG